MHRYWILLLSASLVPQNLAQGQPNENRLAAYESLDVPKVQQTVQFAKRATVPGDRVDQTLHVSLQLDSTVRQGDQVVDSSSTALERIQQRTIIAEQISGGRTTEARVRFNKYERIADGGATEALPVVGKTYLCRRLADDTLSVVRADGSFAGPDEFQLVSESMESLGRPNPLAEFLAGRTIAVGEEIIVPDEVGAALLGSDEALGIVSRFTLTLRGMVDSAAANVARFDAEIETGGANKTQLKLIVNGELDIDVDSCRTHRMALSGPLGMATTMGSYSTAQTTFVRGKLKLETTAAYADGRN